MFRFFRWEQFYGPEGWCNTDALHGLGNVSCACGTEAWTGPFCDMPKESFCPGQCSGHGACLTGFCKCDEGWYGCDCSRKVAGAEVEPPQISQWLLPVVKQHSQNKRAAQDGTFQRAGDPADDGGGANGTAPKPSGGRRRRRPFIFVYDLPPEYNAHMLQYKVNDGACSWRIFEVRLLLAWGWVLLACHSLSPADVCASTKPPSPVL